MEHASLKTLLRQLGKETLDGIQPRGGDAKNCA